MSKTEQAYEIPCNPEVARNFAAMIDVTTFDTVKRHCKDPRTPIRFAVVLKSGYRLEQLAAAISHSGTQAAQYVFDRAAVTIAIDDAMLDGVDDCRRCQVIYLPPAYLVQLEPDPTPDDGLAAAVAQTVTGRVDV